MVLSWIKEMIRSFVGKRFIAKWDRLLPLDEMLSNRWKKARLLGCGVKTNIYENSYIYGKPKIGKNVWIGPFTLIDGTGGLKIGDGCDISSGVHVYTHSTVKRCVSGRMAKIEYESVKIGNCVFIGPNSIILSGVNIGDYCVIGAGSIVTKNLPAYSLAVGAPAKIIGKVKIVDGEVELAYKKVRKNE